MLGIAILNYKKWKLVVDCIESIRNTVDDIDYKIYIVDNYSNNGSVEELSKIYKNNSDIVIIETKYNSGFSQGNNIGSRKAIADGCEYLLIVNSDVVFLKNSIKNMMESLIVDNKCVLTYPCVLNSDNSYQIQECMVGKRNWIYDMFLIRNNIKRKMPEFITKKYFKKISELVQPIETNMYFGCCYMVRSKLYKKLGMLDENVFLYYEELIFSIKALKNKYKLIFVPNAKIKHLCGASSNPKKLKMDIKKSRYYYLKEIQKYPSIICMLDKML